MHFFFSYTIGGRNEVTTSCPEERVSERREAPHKERKLSVGKDA